MSHGNGTNEVRSILCDRGRFFPNGTTKQSLSCLLSDRNPRIKKKETLKLPRATQTKQTNPLQCNQCLMRQFECVLRFECFYISERSNVVILPFSREENIVDIFFDTHTKKAKTQKRSSMHLLLYSDSLLFFIIGIFLVSIIYSLFCFILFCFSFFWYY